VLVYPYKQTWGVFFNIRGIYHLSFVSISPHASPARLILLLFCLVWILMIHLYSMSPFVVCVISTTDRELSTPDLLVLLSVILKVCCLPLLQSPGRFLDFQQMHLLTFHMKLIRCSIWTYSYRPIRLFDSSQHNCKFLCCFHLINQLFEEHILFGLVVAVVELLGISLAALDLVVLAYQTDILPISSIKGKSAPLKINLIWGMLL